MPKSTDVSGGGVGGGVGEEELLAGGGGEEELLAGGGGEEELLAGGVGEEELLELFEEELLLEEGLELLLE